MRLAAESISSQHNNGNRKTLDNMSMSLEQDERVGIMAPSGFRETTFCKILAGYENPDHERVLLDGKPLSGYESYCLVRMAWQHPEISVNPRLRMTEITKEGDGVEERILNGLGIELSWMNRLPNGPSGGGLQRLCTARTLGKRTWFLLADEISTMLDLITQSQIWNFLLEGVGRRRVGPMVVSYSGELLGQVCTRIVGLKEEI